MNKEERNRREGYRGTEDPRRGREECARTEALSASERTTDERLFHALRGIGFMMPGKGRASQDHVLALLLAAEGRDEEEAETEERGERGEREEHGEREEGGKSARGGLTQRELTERLRIRPGSASELLAKLENAGWITRRENETDRRTADILLTDAGREKAAQTVGADRREDLFSALTEEEKETLLSLLDRLRSDWDERFPGKGGPHGPHGRHGPHGHHGPHGPQGFGPGGSQGFGPGGPQGFGPGNPQGFGPRGHHGGHGGPSEVGPRRHHGHQECGSHGKHGMSGFGFNRFRAPQGFGPYKPQSFGHHAPQSFGYHGNHGMSGFGFNGFRAPQGFGPHKPQGFGPRCDRGFGPRCDHGFAPRGHKRGSRCGECFSRPRCGK